MKHGSLFSGMGGFDLAAQWMGWENTFHCEWNDFLQKLLKFYWPQALSYADITKTDFTPHRGTIDILSGGFPCQPYSQAGKRLGKEDERHLWPEMLRAIREIQPRWVVGENVRGLVNWNGGLVFNEVQADLEAEGYEVFPFLLPAAGVNAPHERYRVWFVAYASREGLQISGQTGQRQFAKKDRTGLHDRFKQFCFDGIDEHTFCQRCGQQLHATITDEPRLSGGRPFESWHNWPTQPPVCAGDDGFSARLDGLTFSKWRNESIKAAGNAVVPQVVLQIFKAIQAYDDALQP